MAIECWSWIISSRPDIEPLIVEEMINAWQMTCDLRLGMFAETIEEPNPLAKEEKDELKPRPPANINAHRIWIKYFQVLLKIDYDHNRIYTKINRLKIICYIMIIGKILRKSLAKTFNIEYLRKNKNIYSGIVYCFFVPSLKPFFSHTIS